MRTRSETRLIRLNVEKGTAPLSTATNVIVPNPRISKTIGGLNKVREQGRPSIGVDRGAIRIARIEDLLTSRRVCAERHVETAGHSIVGELPDANRSCSLTSER